MPVAAFAVNYLSEKSLANHLHDHHFVSVVAAVLEHHAVYACLFVCINELPAVVNRICAAYLDCNLLAVLHCVNSCGNVVFPCREHENYLNVVSFDKLAVVLRAVNVPVFLFLAVFNRVFYSVLVNIAYCCNYGVVSFGEDALNVTVAAASDTDYTYSVYFCHVCFSL